MHGDIMNNAIKIGTAGLILMREISSTKKISTTKSKEDQVIPKKETCKKRGNDSTISNFKRKNAVVLRLLLTSVIFSTLTAIFAY